MLTHVCELGILETCDACGCVDQLAGVIWRPADERFDHLCLHCVDQFVTWALIGSQHDPVVLESQG